MSVSERMQTRWESDDESEDEKEKENKNKNGNKNGSKLVARAGRENLKRKIDKSVDVDATQPMSEGDNSDEDEDGNDSTQTGKQAKRGKQDVGAKYSKLSGNILKKKMSMRDKEDSDSEGETFLSSPSGIKDLRSQATVSNDSTFDQDSTKQSDSLSENKINNSNQIAVTNRSRMIIDSDED